MMTLNQCLSDMITHSASDLFVTVGMPISAKINGKLQPLTTIDLSEHDALDLVHQSMNEAQRKAFDTEKECNFAIHPKQIGRFRVNIFRQRNDMAMVIRSIKTELPDYKKLGLPEKLTELVMVKRGLIIFVGGTGSGKSTSLAALIDFRNKTHAGHIITIEDPIEFQHSHQKSIVTQRDVGIDTLSFEAALKNALRQRPDVVLIGEIRDKETMEHAINFAETGHLCLATLHANNCPQTIERILSFFPEEKHRQILMNLALNLKGILSQRLVKSRMGARCIVSEIMLNQGLVRELIEEGKVKEIRQVMERNSDVGMQTFDQALLTRYIRGEVTQEVALAESDNPQNLKLRMKQAIISPMSMGGVAPPVSSGDEAPSLARHHLEI